MIVDAAFFTANLSKFIEGGYVPVILAILVYSLMLIWHKGTSAVSARLNEAVLPIDAFVAHLAKEQIARVPGTAVFLTRTAQDTPPVLMWHVKQNRALHKHIFILNIITLSIPWVRNTERLSVKEISPDIWRASASYGFMEQPNVPKLLKKAIHEGCNITLKDATYYVGHDTIIARNDGKGLPKWIEAIYAFMQRNALHSGEYFQLPSDAVVEIGRQIGV
jgi:KUP system potassium uptake protein